MELELEKLRAETVNQKTELANLKNTVNSQNQIIADLQELLLKKQGVDMSNEVQLSQQNDNFQCYLFTDHP